MVTEWWWRMLMTEIKPSEQYEVAEPAYLWRCPNGHTLGIVRRHNGIRRLELYRLPGGADVVAVLTGSAEICCASCGEVRAWFAPEEGMRELLARRGIGVESK